jgi:hypothetical protein
MAPIYTGMGFHHRNAVEWAGRLAARLRVLMVSAEDENPEVRRKSLLEELNRELRAVAPSDREVFLQALETRFPAWDSVDGPALANGPVASYEPVPGEKSEAILQRLLQAVSRLGPEARRDFIERLTAAGIDNEGNRPAAPELSSETAELLGLRPGQGIAPERLVELLSAVIEPLLSLDQLMRSLRHQLFAPPGGQRRPPPNSELKEAIRRYLSGESDARIERVALAVSQCAKTFARLVHAMGGGVREFAQKQEARFAPAEIKELADLQRGYTHIERKCWWVYVRLAEEYGTEIAIEKQIQDCIATRLRDFTSV